MQRPDRDNLEKAFLDALYGEDSHFWNGESTKVWDEEGRISVVIKPSREKMRQLAELIRESLM
jgi:Holliday junction resolvase RusA-like endonuclease